MEFILTFMKSVPLLDFDLSCNYSTTPTFDVDLNADDVVIGVRLKKTYFVENEDEREMHVHTLSQSSRPYSTTHSFHVNGCITPSSRFSLSTTKPISNTSITCSPILSSCTSRNAIPQMFNYLDMWGDCWCFQPHSVRQLWERYLHLSRFILPMAVLVRKTAYWKRENDQEMAIRDNVAKRIKYEHTTHSFIEQQAAPIGAKLQEKKNSRNEYELSQHKLLQIEKAFDHAHQLECQIQHECAKVLALHVALTTQHVAIHGSRTYGDGELFFPITRTERQLKACARNDVTRRVVDMDIKYA